MASHPPPVPSRGAGNSLILAQYVRNDLGEVASGSRGHHQSNNRDRLTFRAVPRNRLHGKGRAAEAGALNTRVGKEPIQQDFLNCKGLEKRGVLFFWHVCYRASHNADMQPQVPSKNFAVSRRRSGNNSGAVFEGST